MPGVDQVFQLLKEKGFKIGLATSSPLALVKVVAEKLQINDYLQAIASAEELKYGKPHPQVYLDCAAALEVSPLECVCLEDSFNGMIAVKAARMKCIVIPAKHQQHQTRWDAADIKLPSLLHLNEGYWMICNRAILCLSSEAGVLNVWLCTAMKKTDQHQDNHQ